MQLRKGRPPGALFRFGVWRPG